MTYRLEWLPAAEQVLAAIGPRLAGAAADDLARAIRMVELVLEQDPDNVGKPLFDTVYRLTIPPLLVEYEIVAAERRVAILAAVYQP
jgi:hypothetical protein